MYYSGSVERRYGLSFDMAIAMENQTLPRGLGALWAGAGARYSWRGVCSCATRMKPVIDQQRPSEMYWWKGPDDSRILMKWYSHLLAEQKPGVYQPGTYLEANNPALERDIPLLSSAAFRARYPYKIVGIFGEGGDNLSTMNDQFVRAAKQLSRPDREVIVSNEEDFFHDFEKTYGTVIPTVSTGLGNEWDLYSASMQEVASSVRRATEKLRSAEALETLVSLKRPEFSMQFTPARDKAWTAFGLFWEHDWTADNPKLARSIRADWQRRIAGEITSYVDRLYSSSAQQLGSLIARCGSEPRYFVFNPLNWMRTDFADLPYSGPRDIHVVDLTTGETVVSQFVDDGLPRHSLRIEASGIPPVGYKVFAVVPGAAPVFQTEVSARGDVLENARYRIQLDPRGAIVSLIDKKSGNRELASVIDGRAVNDLGPGSGTLSIKNDGPVSVTMQARVSGLLPHTTEVTLFRDSDRVAIRNEITANFSAVSTWAFSFNLRSPDVWHEEVGAINHARIAPEGDYAARFSRLDWLTLNHFVTISGADGAGITLSNSDDAFMKLGRSTIADGVSQLDTATPQISVLAGGQVDGPSLGIPNQGGDSYFLQRFALRSQEHFNAADSMRFALEDQNPLVAGEVSGGHGYPETEFSLLQASDPNVLLWALKPSEEGISKGVVARFWNMSPNAALFDVKLQGGLSKASTITHIETDPSPAQLEAGELRTVAEAWQLRTFLLQPALNIAARATGVQRREEQRTR
jgi:alpha-mannosidase